jgi:hypothetical protein
MRAGMRRTTCSTSRRPTRCFRQSASWSWTRSWVLAHWTAWHSTTCCAALPRPLEWIPGRCAHMPPLLARDNHSINLECQLLSLLLHALPAYLEARCVCRQAAIKATKILPLVGLLDPSKTQSTVGTVLSIYIAPRAANVSTTPIVAACICVGGELLIQPAHAFVCHRTRRTHRAEFTSPFRR